MIVNCHQFTYKQIRSAIRSLTSKKEYLSILLVLTNKYLFRLVSDTGKCLIGSSALYDMRKSTFDSITDEACDKLLLDLEVKSCVDANTMDNVMLILISINLYNCNLKFLFF